MRRSIVALGLLLAAVVALSAGPRPLTAQPGTPPPTAGFVGSWFVTITSPGSPPTQNLTTLTADGTVLTADGPVSPAGAGGMPVTILSAGHGVWQATGATTADLTFVELDSDLQGHLVGTITVSVHLTLGADGKTLRGPFRVMLATPRGKVRATRTGTGEGTRT